jgi:hypothetical protein
MKKNTLYILAAAALVGYYFWNKNKKATTTTASAPAELIKLAINDINEMPALQNLPFSVTDAQSGPGQQISPTPASVLDPAQLIKFNTAVKGSLSGVC